MTVEQGLAEAARLGERATSVGLPAHLYGKPEGRTELCWAPELWTVHVAVDGREYRVENTHGQVRREKEAWNTVGGEEREAALAVAREKAWRDVAARLAAKKA